MFVIDIIPLMRGTTLESLSYFSTTAYDTGTIVQIPIRGNSVSGIVMESKLVSSTKTALKAATFSLRKLPAQNNPIVLPRHLTATADTLMTKYPSTKGAVLFALLPPDVRSGARPYPATGHSLSEEDSTPHLLTALGGERFIEYKSIIRSAFAHRGSVLFVVPHTQAVMHAKEALGSGIKDRVICFHSQQTKKQRDDAYEHFQDLHHTTLIITTPNFSYLDRDDITHIIVEEAGSPFYQMRERPHLDHRLVLRTLATHAKRHIIFGDSVLPTEYEHARRQDIYATIGEQPKRLSFSTPLTIVSQIDKPDGETPFMLFSPELVARIKTTLERRRTVFLYSARRGLAPVVACVDCGHIFRCPDSGIPYSLLRTHDTFGNESRWFISSTSGKRVRAEDTCSACGSWRLRERGIGIQHIHDECKKLFPLTPIVTIDHTTADTHKKATALRTKVDGLKGAIVLGTAMALPYLPNAIDLCAVVSLDAVRAIPTWRADEYLFRLLATLREHASTEVIVQTRSETDDVLLYASRGAIERFYDDEISLRQMLNYPPFSTFIFCTWQGSQETIAQTETLLKERLTHAKCKGEFYTNPHSVGGKIIRHCLIRLTVPHPTLIDTLRTLPPYITITINPDRIV
jgi:primosomal protein N'